jgi:hypothetical protein
MKPQYQQWINSLPERVTGQCAERTLEMQIQFPELIRVRGEYLCLIWGAREHWWLKTPEGEIIDPTAKQFPTLGHCEYIERDESSPEPTGMCPNCCDYCYNGGTCCSDKCHREYVAYVMRPW